MKNKILVLTLASLLGGNLVADSQPPSKNYQYWPDTDTEWNKLTNHIMWCYNSLCDRERVASKDANEYIVNYTMPNLVCPFRDYVWMAKQIDKLCPSFINQALAGMDGDFKDYLASKTNGEYQAELPRWTVESLHFAAFGKAHWSTNTALTAWMAVTNRAIVAEVTAAIKLLRWTQEDVNDIDGYVNKPQCWRKTAFEQENAFAAAVSSFNAEFGEAEPTEYASWGWGYDFWVGNDYDEYEPYGEDPYIYYTIGSDLCFEYGAAFDFWYRFPESFYTNRVVAFKPDVSVFFGRTIDVYGYSFPEAGERQKLFFGGDMGVVPDNGCLTSDSHPFRQLMENISPLAYAGLSDQPYESAVYVENGYVRWLLKWNFLDDSPSLPDEPPVEMSDTDRDDLVEIPEVGWIPGSETGTFVVAHEDESPSLYLPLSQPAPWCLNFGINNYLTQGVIAKLPYHYSTPRRSWSEQEVEELEELYGIAIQKEPLLHPATAFSLETRIEEAGIFTNESVHIKQALVIRPRGQAVVFDFPWEGASFSRAGYPVGLNKNLGYVLWDCSEDNCFGSYGGGLRLLFPSGVYHDFDLYAVWDEAYYDGHVTIGYLNECGNDSGNYGDAYYDVVNNPVHKSTIVTNSRHVVSVEWNLGRPETVRYRSRITDELCESVQLEYEADGRIKKLSKMDSLADAEITGEGRVAYGTGISCVRRQSGSRDSGRIVTIEKILGGAVAPYFSRAIEFDSRLRLRCDTVSSGQSQPYVTEYEYLEESQPDERYLRTGMLVRNSVSIVDRTTSVGTFSEYFDYTADEGWIDSRSFFLSGEKVQCDIYEYADSPYDGYYSRPPRRRLSLLSLSKQLNGDVFSKTAVNSYLQTFSIDTVAKVCATPASPFDAGENLTTCESRCRYGSDFLLTREYPGFSYRSLVSAGIWGGSETQVVMHATINGSITNTVTANSFGVELYSRKQTREGAVLAEVVTHTDGQGRPTCRHFMDDTSVSFQEYCLHGPKKIVNRDGSFTMLDYDPFGRIKQRVDGETGITSVYEYDPLGNVTHQTRMAGGKVLESFATYGLDGTLLYAKDESGHEVSTAGQYVDGYLVLTRSETGRGNVVETYWGDGVLKSVSGPGAVKRFDRERGVSATDNKHWFKETNPENPGEWVKDWYSFNGLYESTERPGGVVEYVEYDQRLDVKAKVSGDAVKGVFTHDAGHFGLPVLSGLSAAGAQSLNLASDPFCTSNAYSFTSQGLKTTRYSFPEDGSAEPFEEGFSQVSPDGTSGTFEVNGQPGAYSCDAPPSTGTYTKTVNMPDGTVTTATYRKFFLRETTRRDAELSRKITNTFSYDGFGELVAYTTDERGYKETLVIGRNGKRQINRVSSSSRGATTFSLDNDGKITQTASPYAGVTSLDWYGNGLLKSVRNNAGPQFSRTVDAFGRDSAVTRLHDGLTSTLGFDYGVDGGFNSKSRDGVQTLSVTARRADGRPKTTVLPGGVTVSSTYDGVGNLVAQTHVDPGDASATVSESYSWHRDGSLRKAAQSGGPQVSNSVFRAGNRVISEKSAFEWPLLPAASVLTALSGPGGRPDGVTAQFAGFTNMSLSVGAEYDALSHLGTLTGDGFYATFATTSGGLVTNTLVAVGGVELLNREVTWSAAVGKSSRVDYTLGGQFLRRWQYAFTNGLIRSVMRSGGDSYRTDYGYDGAGQLLSAASLSTNGLALGGLSFGYSYSSAGDTLRFGRSAVQNSASAAGDLHSKRTWTPSVPILGRVSTNVAAVKVAINSVTNPVEVTGNMVCASVFTTVGIHACTAGVAVVIAAPPAGTADTCRVNYALPAIDEGPIYNARGMILSDSRRQYRWDAAGRLTAVTNFGVNPAVALKFDYFVDGRRATKTVMTLTNGAWVVSRTLQYAWEGWKLAAECERDGAGNIAAVRHFVWGPDLAGQQTASLDSDAEGVGGLLLIREWKPTRGIRIYLPLTDGLGSVCGLIDASDGSLAAEYDYDPYGNPVIGRGPAMEACPFRHRTRYYDPETWLYYYGYRFYDPSVTKWISKDPLGEAGGWNLTCFCDNDPVNKFDPLGDKAYGNDYSGPLEWMDWVEKAYTQKEVDKVYAYLKKRDRHIYNPGLGNTETDRLASKQLLEKALGVPVEMAWNPTFRRLGDDVMNAGAKISDYSAPWYHLHKQAANLTGGAVWLVGGALNVAGISADVGVAAVEKVPFVRTQEPTYQDSMRLYKGALMYVMALNDPDAMVYGWMHSEGAIHGCAILDSLSKVELNYVHARTFGAGSYLFRDDALVDHYGNENKWKLDDFVPGVAGVDYLFSRSDIKWKKVDRRYVHGLDSYVRAHLIEDNLNNPYDGIAKEYFLGAARKLLGH